MRDDITCVFEGVAGVGGIYISNLKAAQNKELLKKLAIKAIVTAVRNGNVKHDKQDVTDHLYVPADDIESYDLSKHFEETYKFIDDVRKKTNVLVHCYAGISRSATIVIAYLLKKYNYSLSSVIQMVKRRRNKINPNKGFIQQLKQEAKRMDLPVDVSEKQFAELLKPKIRSISKDIRKSFSAQKAFYRRTQELGLTTKNFYERIEDKGYCSTLNEENREDDLKGYRTFQGFSKQPKEINQNEMEMNKKVEEEVKKSPIIKQNLNIPSNDCEKFVRVNRKTKLEDITAKIQRIKSKVLESSSKNKKRTRSELGSPLFSMTIPNNFNRKGDLRNIGNASSNIESITSQKQQIRPSYSRDSSLINQSVQLSRMGYHRDIAFNNY